MLKNIYEFFGETKVLEWDQAKKLLNKLLSFLWFTTVLLMKRKRGFSNKICYFFE